MKIIAKKTNFDFMRHRKPAYIVSIILIIIAIVSFATRGLNYGIDFTGGTIVELSYEDGVDLEQVRQTLLDTDFNDAIVQYFGTSTEVLVRIPPQEGMNSADISSKLIQLLGSSGEAVQMRRVEFVGPQVGEELREDGGLAMIYALVGILIYVAIRFQTRFSVGAIAALIHDVTLTIGFFSVTQINFDLTVLAAILAVIGYSLNDTIVVFDRIRENFHQMRKALPVEVMNISINQTLSRTIVTGVTTLLVLFALLFLGGEIIFGFALALIIGIVIGTYSSIFIASPVTLALGVSRQDLLPVEKEGTELDNLP